MHIKNFSLFTGSLLLSLAGHAAGSLQDWSAASGLPGGSWTATGAGAAIDSSILTIDTSVIGSNGYFLQSDVITKDGISLEASARYVSGYAADPARQSMVIAVTQGNNWGNGLYIGNGEIFILSDNMVKGLSATVDTHDSFHTYKIEVGATNGVGPASFNVYYDGTLKLSGSTFNSTDANGNNQSVYWGEGSSLAYGQSEWAFVRNTAPIPEPETYAMLLAGLGLIGGMARRHGSAAETRRNNVRPGPSDCPAPWVRARVKTGALQPDASGPVRVRWRSAHQRFLPLRVIRARH